MAVPILINVVLIALTMLTPRACFAQWDYDRHVIFDNSLPDRSYYRSHGSFVSPSELELVDGKLPVEERHCVTPPNCLRLKWRSQRGGDWRLSLDLRKHWGGLDFSGAGLIWKLFMSNPEIGEALKKIGFVTDQTENRKG
jgi:exo beta-1,2-glucooligosaccharide sophorohydrolase (non-reducing end)